MDIFQKQIEFIFVKIIHILIQKTHLTCLFAFYISSVCFSFLFTWILVFYSYFWFCVFENFYIVCLEYLFPILLVLVFFLILSACGRYYFSVFLRGVNFVMFPQYFLYTDEVCVRNQAQKYPPLCICGRLF